MHLRKKTRKSPDLGRATSVQYCFCSRLWDQCWKTVSDSWAVEMPELHTMGVSVPYVC